MNAWVTDLEVDEVGEQDPKIKGGMAVHENLKNQKSIHEHKHEE
jgi:hypothetical protein